MKVISRKEAVEQGLKFYFTGKPCKRGHLSQRTLSRNCVDCNKDYRVQYHIDNREVACERTREWYANNKDRALENVDRYTRKNYELHKERCVDWSRRNRDKVHTNEKKSRLKHAGRKTARNNKRRAFKLRAIPKWADLKAIEKIYEESKRMTIKTNKQHHVDHIIPLQGETVCGLHCEDNLRVILARLNLQKSNKLVEEIS